VAGTIVVVEVAVGSVTEVAARIGAAVVDSGSARVASKTDWVFVASTTSCCGGADGKIAAVDGNFALSLMAAAGLVGAGCIAVVMDPRSCKVMATTC